MTGIPGCGLSPAVRAGTAQELARHAARAAWALRRADRAEAAELADPLCRRAVESASEREATTRPVNADIALLQEMLASGAPETAEHKAAIKEVGEAAARRDAETSGDWGVRYESPVRTALRFGEGDGVRQEDVEICSIQFGHARSSGTPISSRARAVRATFLRSPRWCWRATTSRRSIPKPSACPRRWLSGITWDDGGRARRHRHRRSIRSRRLP